MHVRFKVFRDTWSSWESLFGEAAEFASRLGPERVISISHSEDGNDGVVTVWYWDEFAEADIDPESEEPA